MMEPVKAAAAVGGAAFLTNFVAIEESPAKPVIPQRDDLIIVLVALRQQAAVNFGQLGVPSRIKRGRTVVERLDPNTPFSFADRIDQFIAVTAGKIFSELPVEGVLDDLAGETTPEVLLSSFAATIRRYNRALFFLKDHVLQDNAAELNISARKVVLGGEGPGTSWVSLSERFGVGEFMPFDVLGDYWTEVSRVFLDLNSFAFDSNATYDTLFDQLSDEFPNAPATLTDWVAEAGKVTAEGAALTIGSVIRVLVRELSLPVAIAAGGLLLFRAVEARF